MEHNQEAVLNSDVCPVCSGTGYELYRQRVDGYKMPLEFARSCTRCRTRRRLQDLTGAPPQFRDADISKFGFGSYSRDMGSLRKIVGDFLKNYQERWEKAGKGLYLWSKTPGSGKTFLSCCVGKSVMIKYDLQMRFITVPDYLAKVGESYKRQMEECDESAVYRECDLLIFDDIGAQKSGEWQQQEVFRIINERLNAGKVIIFTSNMCPEELNLDNRTIDRIMKKSVVLQMPEESIRGKEAKKEQERFLADILHT
ncbi:MAG: ATP-binding protein [Lachnospiraceae bacterium]